MQVKDLKESITIKEDARFFSRVVYGDLRQELGEWKGAAIGTWLFILFLYAARLFGAI
jgi:hypothetical protein